MSASPSVRVTIFDPRSGRMTEEVISGAEQAARKAVEASGRQVVSVQAEEAASRAGLFRSAAPRRMGLGDLLVFCRSMAIMLKGGLTSAAAMEFYGESAPAAFRGGLAEAAARVGEGQPLDGALARTGFFDDVLLGTVRAGLASGALGKCFEMLGERYRTRRAFAAKLRKALAVPVVVTAIMLAIFFVGQLWLIPMVEQMLADARVSPDPFSAVTFAASGFFRATWWAWAALVAGAAGALCWVPAARRAALYALMSRVRSVRVVVMGLRQISLVGTLRVLYDNGVPMREALGTAADTLRGTAMREEVLRAAQEYASGVHLHTALRNNTSCDERLVHMIRVSEATDLRQQLANIEQVYVEETEDNLDRLALTINLGAYAVAAALIVSVFVSAYLPIVLMSVRLMSAGGF